MRLKETIECDVLYIHPSKSLVRPDYGIIPVGVFPLLQSIREKHFKVHGINMAVELSLNPEFNLEAYIQYCNYSAIMIDLHWYEHSYGAIEVAKISKRHNPNSKVILGGLTSSIYAEEILKNFSCVDYVIKGDADNSVSVLVEHIIKGQEDITKIPNLYYRDNDILYTFTTTTENLSKLDYVSALEVINNWSIYLKANVMGIDWFKPVRSYWLSLARGCPFQCSYCGGSKEIHKSIFDSPKLRMRDLAVVKSEIIKLKNRYGVLQIKPTHDIAMFFKKYWIEFIDILKEEDIGLYNEFWQLPKYEFVEYLLENINLRTSRLALTAISGNQDVRISHGKMSKNEDFLRIVELIAKYNVGLDVYFSPNLPGETLEVFLNDTVPFIRKIRELNPLVNVYLQPITLEPNSKLAKELPNISLKNFNDYYHYCQSESRLENLGFESDYNSEIYKIMMEIHNENYNKEAALKINYDYSRL